MLTTRTHWRGNEAQLALRSAEYWPCHCLGACFFPVRVTTPSCLPEWIMLQRCMGTCIKYWEQCPWIRQRGMLCVQINSAPLLAYWHGVFFFCLFDVCLYRQKAFFLWDKTFYHIIELLNLVVFFLNIWIICFAFVFIATYKISKSYNRSYIHTVRFIYVC